MTDDRLPPYLVAKLDQSVPEIRCVARMLAAFYKELLEEGIPADHATWLTGQIVWQVTEDFKGGEE